MRKNENTGIVAAQSAAAEMKVARFKKTIFRRYKPMLKNSFTVEEINIAAMFMGATRLGTMKRIIAALPHMDEDFVPIAVSVIEKLGELEEKEFAGHSFTPADETEG